MGVEVPSNPINRKEQYLAKIAGQAVEIPAEPLTREEAYLDEIAKNGSGGGGGTTNYNSLSNKPQIAGTELQGNKSLADLGIASASDLAAKQNALTAGDYIDITNDEISVNREIPSVIAEYEIKTEPMVEGQAFISVTKTVNGEVVLTQKYGSNTAGINQGINFDDNIYVDYSKTTAWSWTYKLRNASVDHAANYTQSWNYNSTVDYTEEFIMTDHSGDKLVIKSEMDTALSGKQDTLTFDDTPIQNSTNPVKSGGVYSALAGKQNALSAGSYIDISGNAVSVNRYVNPAGDIVYRAVTVNATTAYVDKYTSGGSFIERINITVNVYQTQDVESKIRFYREFDGWVITLLANSKEHNAGYRYSARTSEGGVESQNDFTFVISQTLDDNDLIIRSELATKANTDMVAADFNTGTSYTAGNYCVQDGKLYKFKNNHSGAWSSADVDEVKITGELSALKSGLIGKVAVKYSESNWSLTHAFPVETEMRIGVVIIGDGTTYTFEQFIDGSVALAKISGTNNITPTVSDGNNVFALDTARSLTIWTT